MRKKSRNLSDVQFKLEYNGIKEEGKGIPF